jgi:hypothetical protein
MARLENYTFLTSEMALARHNVHAGRKRQFLGGISNVHKNFIPSSSWLFRDQGVGGSNPLRPRTPSLRQNLDKAAFSKPSSVQFPREARRAARTDERRKTRTDPPAPEIVHGEGATECVQCSRWRFKAKPLTQQLHISEHHAPA